MSRRRRRERPATPAEQAALDAAISAADDLLAAPSRRALARFEQRLAAVYAAHKLIPTPGLNMAGQPKENITCLSASVTDRRHGPSSPALPTTP